MASLGASQWPQGDLVVSSQPVATVQTGKHTVPTTAGSDTRDRKQ